MPKVIDHDQRRKDIIEVTRGLIVRGGIEAATMREIASEAGFANGALKHYFPGKDEIIQGAYERSLGALAEQVAAAVGDKTGIDALRAISRVAMPLTEEAVTEGRVLLSFWERAVNNEELHDTYLASLEVWRDGLALFITQGREAGDIVTATPDDQLVDELVLLTAGANIMSLLAPERTTVALREAHLDAFFERLGRR